MRNINFDQRIPLDLKGPEGWKDKPIKFKKDNGLVALGPFSEFSDIYTDAIYAGQRINSPYHQNPLEGSLVVIYAARQDALRLREAQNLLPQGIYLVALDIYRPLEVQQSLFDKYYRELQTNHPDLSQDQLLNEAQKYVSLPSKDPQKPSPHNTAGSSDVALFRLPKDINKEVTEISNRLDQIKRVEWVNKLLLRPENYGWQEIYELEYRRMVLKAHHGQWLDFGTAFDCGGEEAALNYYEILAQTKQLDPQESEILHNRRLLYNLMITVGFQPYLYEWWHYNSPESQMGAQTANLSFATVGAKTMSEQNLAWEQIMKGFQRGIARNWRGQGQVFGKIGPLNETAIFVRDITLANGNPEFTTHQKADSI